MWIKKYKLHEKLRYRSWWIGRLKYFKSSKKRQATVENKQAYAAARKELQDNLANQNQLILRTRIDNPSFPTISHYCDWSITQYGFAGNITLQPKTVYVQADPKYILNFYKKILPKIAQFTRFTLVTGSSDRTVPRQLDLRYQSYNGTSIEKVITNILSDPRIIHWFADNCDIADHRITPIPIGYRAPWDGNKLYRDILLGEDPISLGSIPLKAFCAHRHRDGPQWAKRKKASELAIGPWREVVDHYESIHPKQFFHKLKEYPFTICIGGGGLDASPKAWTALLAGSIPIIEKNPTTKQAYSNLPVVYVEKWDEQTITRAKLSSWLINIRHFYEDPTHRQEVLYKLSMEYWWGKICAH